MRPLHRAPMLPTATFLAAGLLLSLAGCGTPQHYALPDPQPSGTPVFASDEDALAAAEEAYAAYLAVSDAITADGGAKPERVAELVGDEYLVDALDGFAIYKKQGLTTEGASSFDTMSLQQYSELDPGLAAVAVYVCLDVSGVRVFDKSSADITPDSRTERLPLEVRFVTDDSTSALLVEGSEPWSGEDFCLS